jgi:hypothetical protein
MDQCRDRQRDIWIVKWRIDESYREKQLETIRNFEMEFMLNLPNFDDLP